MKTRHVVMPAYLDAAEGDISEAGRARVFALFPVQNTPMGGFLALRGILGRSSGGGVTQPTSSPAPATETGGAAGTVDFSSFLEQ